ncbi:MAG: hypothetical protein AAB358_02320 [Patescibacteria group bacterium]
MFITVHAVAATIVGKQIHNSALAFLVGMLSHFILDMIPHGDENLGDKFFGIKIREKRDLKMIALYGACDAFVLAIYLIFLFKNFSFAKEDSVSWAIIGGLLPDIMVVIYKMRRFKILKKPVAWHFKIHHFLIAKTKFNPPLKYGVIMQIFLFAALLFFVFYS